MIGLKHFGITASLIFSCVQILAQGSSTSEINEMDSKIIGDILLLINYPKEAQRNGVEGRIIVKFDMDSTCSIVNIRKDRKLGYGCEQSIDKGLDEFEKKLKEKVDSRCSPRKDMILPVVFKLL